MNPNERFYSLNSFLRERHGDKVIKLSIDGGFTCPNRDGTLSDKGCIFCSSEGSGDFAPSACLSISEQLKSAQQLLANKWTHSHKYIVYFQSYTNTYAPIEVLKEKYETALSFPGVVGLAIATRPDCLDEALLDYLEALSKRTHLWVELGLQTIHPESSLWINQGYYLDCFETTVHALHQRNIESVVHLILGLPNETHEMMLETAGYISKLPLQGIKIHMLHILDNARLGNIYLNSPFPLLTEDEYIYLLGEIIKKIPKHFVIHRLTGDGDAKHLIAPLWTKNKRQVLNHIHRHLKEHNIYQGQNFYI